MSDAKLSANRDNAKKSTGPKTDEGRRKSAMNAVRHGFCARTVCVHGEEAEQFNALVTEFAREHRPASATEYALVYRMAVASWNLRRLTEAETSMIDAATLTKGYENGKWGEKRLPIGEAMLKVMKDDKRFNTLQIYQQRLERAFYRALSELRRVRHEVAERSESVDDDDRVSAIEMSEARTDPVAVVAPVEGKQNEQTNPPPPQGKDAQAVATAVPERKAPYIHVDPLKLLSPWEKRICNESRRQNGLEPLPMDKRVMTDGTILPD